jgi:hypothetical protein
MSTFQHRLLDSLPPDAAPPVYPWLHGGRFVGSPDFSFPDPLQSYVWDAAHLTDPLEPLQSYALLPVAWAAAPAQSFALSGALDRPGTAVTVRGSGELQLDFGVESAGWVEFESDDLSGDVEVAISEYNRPAAVNLGAQNPVKSARPERHGSTWRLRLNREYYEGVRFAWLCVRDCPVPWTLRNLRLVCQAKPLNYEGAFRSGDAVLDGVYAASAYAVRLNFLRDQIGAILMERSDRHSWTGDALVTHAAALAVFGAHPLILHNTRRMRDDINGTEGYSLYWIHLLLDLVLHSGDKGLWQQELPVVRAKLARAREVIDGRLALGFCGHDDRTGAAFEEPDCDGNRRFFRFLAARTARRVEAALAWNGGCAETALVARALLADASAGDDEEIHAGNEALLGGFVADPAAFAQRHFHDPVRRASYSPFNAHFLLEGMAACGCHAEAEQTIRDVWGGMLSLGATTFWESFRPAWGDFLRPNDTPPNGPHGYTSLCHPWSSGPAAWLRDHALGVRPLAPGFAEFRLDDTSQLDGVAGRVPTPRGPIDVERRNGHLEVSIPEGVRARLASNENIIESGQHRLALPPARRLSTGFSPPAYPTRWLTDTGPDFVGDLAGWIALAGNPDGSDLMSLPEGVCFDPRDYCPHGHPRRLHLASPGLAGWRADVGPAGAWTTRNPEVVAQSFAFNVHLPGGFRVGLYFADPQGLDWRQTVDVLRLPSLDLLLPTRLVEEAGAGRVLWFAAPGSFRVRICNFSDADGAVSAILPAATSPDSAAYSTNR